MQKRKANAAVNDPKVPLTVRHANAAVSVEAAVTAEDVPEIVMAARAETVAEDADVVMEDIFPKRRKRIGSVDRVDQSRLRFHRHRLPLFLRDRIRRP